MNADNPALNILLPVYNEEKRLRRGVEQTREYLLTQPDIPFVLTIADNASSDGTADVARDMCARFPEVRYLHVAEKGVGAAFRAGVAASSCPFVGYMDVDLSTDVRHLREAYDILRGDPSVGMVNGSRWSRASETTGRRWYRSATSLGLVWLLKAALGLRASDAICGFKFFRRETARDLIAQTEPENGWFFLIEMLIRAERSGVGVRELPVRWRDDSGNSTVHVVRQTAEYLRQTAALRRRLSRRG